MRQPTAPPPRAPAAGTLATVLARQNPDGGWPYAAGPSWTEPTVLALLAALAAGEDQATQRGLAWLAGMERSDGGWAPQKGVEESTWVTALVALLPADRLGLDRHRRAIQWLGRLAGKEAGWVFRLRLLMSGQKRPADQEFPGWPWFPGTASWVGPTSFAILALRRECQRSDDAGLRRRLEEGRRFLLLRRCTDGGWNHGGRQAIGVEAGSYPETTGLALLALAGVQAPALAGSVATAERYLAESRSADARHWLRLGLLAQGRRPAVPPAEYPAVCRNVRDLVLASLADQAAAGRNAFL